MSIYYLARKITATIVVFLVAEIFIRLIWNPLIIGEKMYGLIEPTYSYGYATDKPKFYRKGGEFICYPSPVYKFYKERFGIKKKANERRIFVIGSSVCRGEKVDYPHLLESLLKENASGIEWRVFNFSIGGFGSARTLLTLKNVIKYKPDLLVLNIAVSNEYEDERDLKLKAAVNSGIYKFLHNSYFYVVLKEVFFKYAGLYSKAAFIAQTEKEATRNKENLKRWKNKLYDNTAKMIDLAKNAGIPVILVGQVAYPPRYQATNRIADLNNIFKKFVSGLEVSYFDTYAATLEHYPDAAGSRFLFTADECHFTDEGHKFTAKILNAFILDNYGDKLK